MLVDLGVVPATTTAGVLAQNPEPPPGQGAEFGKSSPVALVVIVLLALATIVLIRSMSKHINRVPESFEPKSDDASGPATGSPERDVEDAGDNRA